MSWLDAFKRRRGRDQALRYLLAVVRPPWTEAMIRALAQYWVGAAFCAAARQEHNQESLLQLFDGKPQNLRKARELAELTFFRFFPIVGLLTYDTAVEEVRRLPFVASTYAPPEDYGFDYLHILKGLHYVLEHNQQNPAQAINVVNMSLQTPAPYPFDPLEPMNVATRTLVEHGVVVVVAAGNHGAGGNGTLSGWAGAPWLISVGAAHEDGKRLWERSSRGAPGSPYHPTVVAHGVAVVGPRSPQGVYPAVDAEGRYAVADGTSFAAPQVAGLAALIIQFIRDRLAPSARVAEWRAVMESQLKLRALPVAPSPRLVKRMLEHFAVPMPGYGLHEQGAGFLNRKIVLERLRDFRFRDFIQVFGLPAVATDVADA